MDYKEIYESWLNNERLCGEAKAELEAVKDNKEEIEYRFGAELEFGTAGMRGIIGYGTNMMNVYTVKRATQGLSEFINTLGEQAKCRGVVISFDTRLKSDVFARAAAEVLAANGVKAYLFDDVHPVPMLSFAVRCLNATAGIMITASHNPKQYNGYKVYGGDGAQMSPEDTDVVVGFIKKITDFLGAPSPDADQRKKFIKAVPSKVDKKYYKELKKLTLSKKAVKQCGKDLKLVYTPVHGSGYVPVTTILKKIGINATVVEEQTKKDVEFSTVAVPNPEFKETLSMGIALAEKIGATVVFGTDPWRADAREAGAGQAAGAENEELRLAADAWAKAFCDRDGNAIASLSTAEYQAYLIEEELLSGVDGDYYGFGWSSPWPWVSGKDYRIVDCTENRTVILYYAWTSVPHVTVWREHLTWEREEGEYRVSAGSLRYLNSISDSGDFAEAYGLGVNGTPIDFLTNGAGEALNENALQNGEYYQALFAPETAARFLLNVSDNEGDAALAAGSRQPDGSVEVAISFPADGGSAVVKMIQPYGEEGIWIVQDAK